MYNDKLISIILQHHGNTIFYYVSPTYIYYFPVLLCLHFPFLYKILMTQKRNLTFFSWIMASEASNISSSSNFSNFSSHLQNHIRGTDASKLLLFGCSRIFWCLWHLLTTSNNNISCSKCTFVVHLATI